MWLTTPANSQPERGFEHRSSGCVFCFLSLGKLLHGLVYNDFLLDNVSIASPK